MGTLRQLNGARTVVLGTRCMVGRAASCGLCLSARAVSSEHALLTWGKEGWTLRDIGSRNGSWLNDHRLVPGVRHFLQQGEILAFGSPEDRWELAEAGPPGLVALGPEGQLRAAGGGLLALPDEDAPQVTLFVDEAGEWLLEDEEGSSPVSQGRQVQTQDGVWTLLLPSSQVEGFLPSTWKDSEPKGSLVLRLIVSQDEEHVDLVVYQDGAPLPLPPRTHHFLTLALARARLRDLEAGAASAEVGWIYTDDLCQMFRVTAEQINLQLFRARRQLVDAGLKGATQLFERRKLSRQLRLNVPEIEVIKLGEESR